MQTILAKHIQDKLTTAFETLGFDSSLAIIKDSDRPELSDYQCNAALALTKQLGKNPREIAEEIVATLNDQDFEHISIDGPGFINFTLKKETLTAKLQEVANDEHLGITASGIKEDTPQKIVIDFGGANIAKALHVGHMRPLFEGDCLQRLFAHLGYDVHSDIHMGDWGLPMGQLVAIIREQQPDLPYFDEEFSGDYPNQSPVTVEDLATLYPQASAKSKEDKEFMAKAKQATKDLQDKKPGIYALWKHFLNISIASLKNDFDNLDITFRHWLGESDSHDTLMQLIPKLKKEGYIVDSEGAEIIHVAQPEDTKEIPPLMMRKSDGAVLYGSTDLATIVDRMNEFDPTAILYVVDQRQFLHFEQVFRAAHSTGIVDKASCSLEHIGFGTINGPDGKPFKTRDGGVMQFNQLIAAAQEKAYERLIENKVEESKAQDLAKSIASACLKFADLANHRLSDYIFDMEKFVSLEGKTGLYIQYAAVRLKSALRKANYDLSQTLKIADMKEAANDNERDLQKTLLKLDATLQEAAERRAPNLICDLAYEIATKANSFYHACHISTEENEEQKASWIALAQLTIYELEIIANIIGFQIPEEI